MLRSYHRLTSLARRLGVTRVARVTGLDRVGVEVACAVRPEGQVLQVCNGKGWSWEHAQASALFEAAELDAAEQSGLESTRAFADELDEAWTPAQLGASPTPFDEAAIEWVRATRLDRRGEVWVPLHAVACPNSAPGPVTFGWSSNAMGAHASLQPALEHALDEAWERHVLAQVLPQGWMASRVAGRRLELRDERLTQLRRRGFEVALFDLGTGEGPAVAGALVFDLEEGPVPLAAGYAARAALDAAGEAAFLEAAQSRLTDIHAAREDVVTRPGPTEVAAFRTAILGLPSTRGARRAEGRPWWRKRPAAYVELGTRPGVRVVKVLVPGFEVSELL